MDRERQVYLIGCWLFGAAVGFMAGAAGAYGACLLLMTPEQRDFFYAAAYVFGAAGLLAAPLGGWGALATARRAWGTAAAPWFWAAAVLSYVGLAAAALCLAFCVYVLPHWRC